MKQLVHQFYQSFTRLDADGMVACYHDDIHFQDPAFGDLHGADAKAMWQMLCGSQAGKDFKVTYDLLDCNDTQAHARWEAKYTFSKTGRRVHNIIDSKLTFADQKIIKHEDDFDLYRWAKQAFGPTGYLIGWTPFFRNKLQGQTRGVLQKYQASLI